MDELTSEDYLVMLQTITQESARKDLMLAEYRVRLSNALRLIAELQGQDNTPVGDGEGDRVGG